MGEWVEANVELVDVNGWLGTLNQYANNAILNAGAAAANLGGVNADTYRPKVNFQQIDSSISVLPPGTRPSKPTLNLPDRRTPSAPSITKPNVVLDNVPTFTEADPYLNLPIPPDPLAISQPVKDFVVDTSLDFPVTPDTTLPPVPTLISLNLPTPQDLTIPTFSLDFPTSNSIIVPGITFSFTEDAYSSPLLTSVKNELLTRLSGGTGLSPEVEEAIWNRERDREQRVSVLAERTLLVDRAAQGFTRPSGATQAALAQIVQDAQAKLIDLGRDIAIKQAELEQENIKNSIQQVITLEDLLIKNHQQTVQRAFEVAKYMQDIQIELFKAQVTQYNSEVEAYKAFTIAYQSKVQAELSKIEIFKAQIDAEKLRNEINDQNIRIYLAQLEGVKSNVEIYKSLIAGVSEKLRAEGLKLEVYKADIEAYSEQVRARASEYQIYSEQIKGELAKVEVFDSKVKAYASKVQAYSALSDVKLKRADMELNVSQLNLKKYEADLEAYIKQVQADQLTYQAAIDIYKGETQLYLADAQVNSSVSELELKKIENIITQNKYEADIAIQNAQITLESIKAAYQSVIEAQKAAASTFQAIGSSALSAINVSAQIQGQANQSISEIHDYSHQA